MSHGYILGIDYGEARLGLAIASSVAKIPKPHATVRNSASMFEVIEQIVLREGVNKIIVGLPRNMDGSLGAQAEKCRAFGEELSHTLRISVGFVEEAASTIEAKEQFSEKTLLEYGIDAASATLILDRYFSEGEVG